MTDFHKPHISDYSQVEIYNKIRNIKLDKTVKILDGVSLQKRVRNDYKIQVTESLLLELENTKLLTTQNLVDKALSKNKNETNSHPNSHRQSPSENKRLLLERRKFIQSAPLNRKKSISDDASTETERIRIDEKTIRRKLQPNQAVSMSVDKWVEIHQRSKSAFFESKKAPLNITPRKSDDHKNLKKDQQQGRSIRELSDLVVLDKVRTNNLKIKEESRLQLQRIKRRDEFNGIVVKIRDFLYNIEKFKYQSSFSKLKIDNLLPQKHNFLIKLYEYA